MTSLMIQPPSTAYPVSALANIEGQRAIQEVQAALVISKRFPRDEKQALDRILNACSRVGLAEQSAYSFSRSGTEITGPSIRLAEAVAGYWGNIEYGFREISRSADEKCGVSEVEAYAWDMETNTRRPARFTVRHWRDTKSGGYAIKEERDIYELIANMAQRRVRACLLAIIPGDIIEEAVRQCETTLAAKADTSADSVAKLVAAFEGIGVSKAQLEKRIQRRMASIVPAQIIGLRKIFASIRDGMSAKEDWFAADAKAVVPSEVIDPFEKKMKKAEPKKAEAIEDDGSDIPWEAEEGGDLL